jgi:hypothetical protein
MLGRFLLLPSRDLDFRFTPSVLAITYCDIEWMTEELSSRLQQLRASNKKRCSVVQVIVWNLLKRPVSFPFGSSLYWYLSIPDSRSYFTLPENKYAMKLRAFNSYYMNGMYRCHLLFAFVPTINRYLNGVLLQIEVLLLPCLVNNWNVSNPIFRVPFYFWIE